MADPLYDELVRLDRGVAEAYKKATHGNPNATIGTTGARLIFAAVIADGKITESEANALFWLVYKANFTDKALETIGKELMKSVDDDAFFRGGATPLVGDAQLANVYRALGMGAVGKIRFSSPGSGVHYTPLLYAAIKELIAKQQRLFRS